MQYNNQVIFIETENPRDLTIAIRVRPNGRLNAYTFATLTYGTDELSRIEDSDQFETIENEWEMPEDLRTDFDYRRNIQPRFVKAYTHKKINQ